MSEHQIKHSSSMTQALLDAVKMLGEKLARIAEAVLKIPDLIRTVVQEINQSSNRIIQARGEMEIYTRLSNAVAKKALMDSENQAIADLKERLDEDFSAISERYDKIQAELNAESHRRIEALDEALLAIPEEFPKAYGQSIEVLTSLLNSLDAVAKDSFNKRAGLLATKAKECTDRIEEFLDGKKKFAANYQNYIHRGTLPATQTLYLPITVVRLKKRDGRIQRCIFVNRSGLNSSEKQAGSNVIDMILNSVKRKFEEMNFESEKPYPVNGLLSAPLEAVDTASLRVLNKVIDKSKIKTLE